VKAEKEYRQFVKWGIGKESIWRDVKGQVLLGEDDFVDSLVDHLRKHKHVPEIPKSQRYANRPTLDKLFQEELLKNRQKRDKMMMQAVEKYGYRQSEIARHLGLHTSTVCNLIRRQGLTP
jgi:transcriptional regulator with GAF, ATPase, and Fis domain